MEKTDGGPAFPTSADNGHSTNQDGMTLRDYFAAKAMTQVVNWERASTPELVAELSYGLADAMLKARQA